MIYSRLALPSASLSSLCALCYAIDPNMLAWDTTCDVCSNFGHIYSLPTLCQKFMHRKSSLPSEYERHMWMTPLHERSKKAGWVRRFVFLFGKRSRIDAFSFWSNARTYLTWSLIPQFLTNLFHTQETQSCDHMFYFWFSFSDDRQFGFCFY